MRLVDFLIHLLKAHAETLQHLAALLGEDQLVAILEELPQDPRSLQGLPAERIAAFLPPLIQPRPPKTQREITLIPTPNPYQELEGAVRGIMRRPGVLEFYLWSYPSYRAYIESKLDLNSRLPEVSHSEALKIVEEAVSDAKLWIRRLPVPAPMALRAEVASRNPWLKFRADVLKLLGGRALEAVRTLPVKNQES